MEILIIGGLILVVLLIVGGIQASAQQATANERRAAATALYPTDELYVSPTDGAVLGLNFSDRKLILGRKGSDEVYDFDRIVAVEVISNGTSISTTNRGSQLAGAAIGGVALGGLGALIGGLSGSRTSRQKLKTIAIKVTVESHSNPVHIVSFMDLPGDGLDANSSFVKPIFELADRFHAHLLNAMRAAEGARPAEPVGISNSTDQIEKLWNMHREGALTEAEFRQEKARLLTGHEAENKPAATSARYSVVVLEAGPDPWAFAEALVEAIPELVGFQVGQKIKNLPATVLSDVGAVRAERLQQTLTAVGATVEVRKAEG